MGRKSSTQKVKEQEVLALNQKKNWEDSKHQKLSELFKRALNVNLEVRMELSSDGDLLTVLSSPGSYSESASLSSDCEEYEYQSACHFVESKEFEKKAFDEEQKLKKSGLSKLSEEEKRALGLKYY